MHVIKVDNSFTSAWNKFVKDHQGSFLQSWEWGEFNQQQGREVIYLAVVDDTNSIQAQCLVIRMPVPFGFFWSYVPHMLYVSQESFQLLIDFVYTESTRRGDLFVHIDPFIRNSDFTPEIQSVFDQINLKKRPHHSVQPIDTIILDLRQPEEALLDAMHKKTRYNIRLATKKGVKVTWGKESLSIQAFYNLSKKVADRQGLKIHSLSYYEELLQLPYINLVVAEFEGTIIAAHIVVIFGAYSIYLHGASDYDYRNLMAPYLLQWESIKFAQAQNCLWYDFWGIAGKGKNTTRWEGITRFKKSFSVDTPSVQYIGLYIHVLRPIAFILYKLLRRGRHVFLSQEVD